jgi:hypothetical protein
MQVDRPFAPLFLAAIGRAVNGCGEQPWRRLCASLVGTNDQPATDLWGYAVWRMSLAHLPRENGTFEIAVKDKLMRGAILFNTTLALAVPAILWPPRPVRAADLVQPVACLVMAHTADSAISG